MPILVYNIYYLEIPSYILLEIPVQQLIFYLFENNAQLIWSLVQYTSIIMAQIMNFFKVR